MAGYPEGVKSAPHLVQSSTVTEDLSAAKGKAAIMTSTAGSVALADALRDIPHGVFLENAATSATSGQQVEWLRNPVGMPVKVKLSGTVSRLDYLKVNGALASTFVKGYAGDIVVAQAEQAGVSGDEVLALWLGPAPHPNGAIRVHVKTVTYASLTTAGTTQNVSISTDDDGNAFPANAQIVGGAVELDTAFSGGTIATMVAGIGDAGDPDEVFDEADVFTTATAGMLASKPTTYLPLFETAYSPVAIFTSSVGNVNAATAGQAKFLIFYRLNPARD